jgi:valyl-tRNA synthetase
MDEPVFAVCHHSPQSVPHPNYCSLSASFCYNPRIALPKAYDPQATEDRIYKMWEDSGAFKADANTTKETFTVSMPPPNATGQLHLGHAVMLALEDIFIRFQRMRGKEALWVPGTDHAAIATNAVMERKLKEEEGVTKNDIGREEFIRRLKDFVSNSRDTIRSQVRKMGSSCDWSREKFTMDETLNRCVNEIFVMMYKDGLIYKGNRIVNWCPHCQSTLSDDEVIYDERQETFFTIKYGPLLIGTVRPETKFGDTAVAVHPDDDRYKQYIGKEIEIETAIGKSMIKVIADTAVDSKFGTGAIKVTPAHDFVDFDMAQRHGLEVVQVIDEQGRMMEKAGPFKGMTTAECREAMISTMREKGILEKEEPYTHNLSVCYRCKHPVEPLPKLQWFMDVNKKVVNWKKMFGIFPKKWSLKEVMQDVVHSGDIKIIPDRFEKIYFHWIDNLRDWCISRQIWWGHQIPVWYKGEEVYSGVQPPEGEGWEQDPDTLDTWFSSALWTWSTLIDPSLTDDYTLSLQDLLAKSPDYQKFHPTQVMETGYDILFFWVARMILMTTYATGNIPFDTVYLHGMIRTRDGAKMSKSHPETMIDPLDIIPKFGADALRLSMIVGQSPGNDSKLFEEKIGGYRNFVNKLWNASRFVLMQCEKMDINPNDVVMSDNDFDGPISSKALISELQLLIRDVTDGLEQYRLSEVGERIYTFVWDYYCDWYLEVSKEKRHIQPTVHTLRVILKLLHPYCPFVTEELWSSFRTKDSEEHLINEVWPEYDLKLVDQDSIKDFKVVTDIISAVRKVKTENDIAPSKKIDIIITCPNEHLKSIIVTSRPEIHTMARVENFRLNEKFESKNISSVFLGNGVEIHIPLEGLIDVAKEKDRLKKEKAQLEKFLLSVQGKLNNAKFMKSAPKDVVEKEKQKAEDAQGKLKKVEEKLALLA